MDAPTRVLTTINHEEPDRVPAFESAFTNNTIKAHYGTPVLGNLIDSLIPLAGNKNYIEILRNRYKDYKKRADSLVKQYEFHRRIKLDIALCGVSLFPRMILDDGSGFVDEYGRIMKYERYKGDGTVIMGYYGGIFKSFEDYESWEPLDPYDEIRISSFLAGKEAQKKMNNDIFVVPSTAAIMEDNWQGFGLPLFSRIIRKHKQAEKIFGDKGKFTLELVKILADNGAEMILLWDDYGFKNGLFINPKKHRTYVIPWLKRICAAAHKRDCKVLLHSDGDLLEIFEDIINSGVDALNPIEPTTANPEYDIFKLNKKYGDKITFVGNISPQMLSTGTISEIEEYSKKLIKELAPEGGYIFSSGHSINPSVTLDRWQTVMNIREKYGKYPISILE
jgi:uroporphyrinogen decarboxylase